MIDNDHIPIRKPTWTRSILGWTISFACLAFIAWTVDFGEAVRTLRDFSWPFLGLALIGLSAGYFVRIVRWSTMLRSTGTPVSVRDCSAPFLGSITLNNVLPLRAGDVVRGTIFPAAIGVPRSTAIGTIVLERLLDLLVLVLFLAIGSLVLRGEALPAWLVESAAALAIAGTASLIMILVFSGWLAARLSDLAIRHRETFRLAAAFRAVGSLLGSFDQMASPRFLYPVVGMSFLVWLGEALAFYAIMLGFSVAVPFSAALLVTGFVTLSTLVPSSPGYVGPFHLAAYTVLSLLGANEETATSFAVLSHLLLWLPTTVAGGLAMLSRPEIFRVTGTIFKR